MLLVLLCPAFILSQQSGIRGFSTLSMKVVDPGVRKGDIRFDTQEGVLEADLSEVDLTFERITLEVAVPVSGPLTYKSISDLGLSVDGKSIFGLTLDPKGSSDGLLKGLLLSDKHVYSWPPSNQPHIYVLSEGSVQIEIPAKPKDVSIGFDSGTSATLKSINGPLPELGNGVSIYTGELKGNDFPAVLWPDDAVIFTFQASGGHAGDIHKLLMDPEVTWVVDERSDRENLRVERNRGALVFLPPVDGAFIKDLQDKASFQFDLQLRPKEKFAKSILPVDDWVTHKGYPLREVKNNERVKNGIAIDTTGRRVLFFTAKGERRSVQGLPMNLVLDYLRDDGYTDFVKFPTEEYLLINDLSNVDRSFGPSRAMIRSGLVSMQKRMSLELPQESGEFYRVEGMIIEAARETSMWNGPSTLVDGRLGEEESLENFWAMNLVEFDDNPSRVRENPNFLKIVLPEPMAIGALDLVHAEEVGFSPQFNLKSFRIKGRLKREDSWEVLKEIRHDEPVSRERLTFEDLPRVSELQLEIIEGTFLSRANVVRLAELVLWASSDESSDS